MQRRAFQNVQSYAAWAGSPKSLHTQDVETSLVPPDLHGGQHKDSGEQRQEDGIGHEPEQLAADEAAENRADCHHQHESAVFTKHNEAAISTIAGETNQHGR